MKNEIQIFNNEQFGQVRTVEQDGKVYFCGKDVAEALGYRDTVNALKQHCREAGVVKHHLGVQTGIKADGAPAYQTVRAKFIDEGNLYRLIVNSKLPSAEQFETWVFDEVLPTLRKTGTYNLKQTAEQKAILLEARQRNARSREANMWLKLADRVPLDTYKQILYSKSAEALSGGQQILPLPKAINKTYTAAEIGLMLGISANKVGKIANRHGLKTAEYGEMVWDKSPYSAHECQTFRYYIEVVSVMKSLLEAA